MKKILLIGSLLMAILLISGCAVSDYITGTDEEKPYSLLTEEEALEEEVDEEELAEIEGLEEELEEELEVDEEELEEEETDAIVITINEAETVNLRPKAKDADEDEITYTFSEPLDENGRWETDYSDAGEYLILVTASDGKLESSRQVLLVVERVNVPPTVLGVPDEITVDEGDILVLEPTASDPNGDIVEVTISDPVGDDGEWVLGYQDAGEYVVDIMATDGELDTIKKVIITVNKKNVAPVLENVEDYIEVDEGEIIVLSPVVTDLNGDDVEVTISDPIGNNGIWETAYTDHGIYTVIVEASDGIATTTKEVEIVVNDINVAPVIDDIVQG